MLIKTKGFQLILALLLGILVMLLPRPEGTTFSISGDADRTFFQEISPHFTLVSPATDPDSGEYTVTCKNPDAMSLKAAFLSIKYPNLKTTASNSTISTDFLPKPCDFWQFWSC